MAGLAPAIPSRCAVLSMIGITGLVPVIPANNAKLRPCHRARLTCSRPFPPDAHLPVPHNAPDDSGHVVALEFSSEQI